MAAPKVGSTLGCLECRPELILSSPAVRAIETAKLVRRSGLEKIPFDTDERLYDSDSEVILSVIHELPDEHQTALLVGHNPEFENVVYALSSKREYIRMPTAALVGLEFAVEKWSEVQPRRGRIILIAYPSRA